MFPNRNCGSFDNGAGQTEVRTGGKGGREEGRHAFSLHLHTGLGEKEDRGLREYRFLALSSHGGVHAMWVTVFCPTLNRRK